VRVVLIGALGLTLLGCSHSAPPQASVASCAEEVADCDDAAQPVKPPAAKPRPVAAEAKPSAAKMMRPIAAAPVAAASTASAKLAGTAADFKNAQASATEPHARSASTVSQPPAPSDAGRKVAATAEERNDRPAPTANADTLVAVVMARPDVKSVAELAGKNVAIDDRYAASSGKVRTAIAAAGATEVQLSEGQATAMSRLGNGEVPAAVVALVAPEAAETFPAIAGYRMFHVPLSPRSVKSAH